MFSKIPFFYIILLHFVNNLIFAQEIDEEIISELADEGLKFARDALDPRELNFRSDNGDISEVDERHNLLRKQTKENRQLSILGIASTFVAKKLSKGKENADPGVLRMRVDKIATKCPELPDCDKIKAQEFRTFDGSCNNLKLPIMGKANTPFRRLLDNAYADEIGSPRLAKSGDELPPAREISRGMQVSSKGGDESSFATLLSMSVGQFLTHDIALAPNSGDRECCSSKKDKECMPIFIDEKDDPMSESGQKCMDFTRSSPSQSYPDCGRLTAREQSNQVTHWIDASTVYGSSASEAEKLKGDGGLLKTDEDESFMEIVPRDESNKTMAGDIRHTDHVTTTVMHNLFLREHNRIATFLSEKKSDQDPDNIFQTARKLVIAQWQHIIYHEYLPLILGAGNLEKMRMLPLKSGFRDYLDGVDARIGNAFSTAALRFGHSQIPNTIKLEENLEFRELFFSEKSLKRAKLTDTILDNISKQPSDKIDSSFSEAVHLFLFQKDPTSDKPGKDLAAINVQRGRDHGLQGYIKYLELCHSRESLEIKDFDDLHDFLPSLSIKRVKELYQDVEDIDLFVGLLKEFKLAESLVGPTSFCILTDTFQRLQLGDRFYYENDGQFDREQLDSIRKTSLAKLICDNTKIKKIHPLALELPDSTSNVATPCSSLYGLDLNLF